MLLLARVPFPRLDAMAGDPAFPRTVPLREVLQRRLAKDEAAAKQKQEVEKAGAEATAALKEVVERGKSAQKAPARPAVPKKPQIKYCENAAKTNPPQASVNGPAAPAGRGESVQWSQRVDDMWTRLGPPDAPRVDWVSVPELQFDWLF